MCYNYLYINLLKKVVFSMNTRSLFTMLGLIATLSAVPAAVVNSAEIKSIVEENKGISTLLEKSRELLKRQEAIETEEKMMGNRIEAVESRLVAAREEKERTEKIAVAACTAAIEKTEIAKIAKKEALESSGKESENAQSKAIKEVISSISAKEISRQALIKSDVAYRELEEVISELKAIRDQGKQLIIKRANWKDETVVLRQKIDQIKF